MLLGCVVVRQWHDFVKFFLGSHAIWEHNHQCTVLGQLKKRQTFCLNELFLQNDNTPSDLAYLFNFFLSKVFFRISFLWRKLIICFKFTRKLVLPYNQEKMLNNKEIKKTFSMSKLTEATPTWSYVKLYWITGDPFYVETLRSIPVHPQMQYFKPPCFITGSETINWFYIHNVIS